MSIAWGPALDAEVNYRHQQLHSDFHRPLIRRPHRKARPAAATSLTDLTSVRSSRREPAHIPAQPARQAVSVTVDQDREHAHVA